MAHTAEESISITGFNHLIRLYKPFDNNFVGFWSHQSHGITADWIVALQRQLTIALPQYLQCTESQMVDLKVSHAWLRLMVWQLAVSYRLITSIPTDQTLSYRYPVEISRELIQQAPRFTQSAMEVHGIGLVCLGLVSPPDVFKVEAIMAHRSPHRSVSSSTSPALWPT